MIIIQMMGGLGNQLQQYAFYKKLKIEGINVKIDDSWFDEKNQASKAAKRDLEIKYLQGIDYEKATAKEISTLIKSDNIIGKIERKLFKGSVKRYEENGRIYDKSLMDGILDGSIKDLYIEAYFACEYYYADILPILREEIIFPVDQSINKEEIERFALSIAGTNSVSIHLRRGDYLDPINMRMFGNICTKEYYDAAISLSVDRLKEDDTKDGTVSFYIFSDDNAYANAYMTSLLEAYPESKAAVLNINHGKESFYDIYLMSLAKANICANSTFSFWGARYNKRYDKLMIRPTIHRNDHVFELEDMKVLWEGWNFVSPDGKVYVQ